MPGRGRSTLSPGHRKKDAGVRSARDFAPGHGGEPPGQEGLRRGELDPEGGQPESGSPEPRQPEPGEAPEHGGDERSGPGRGGPKGGRGGRGGRGGHGGAHV
jgi:translation initiation factor IF-2